MPSGVFSFQTNRMAFAKNNFSNISGGTKNGGRSRALRMLAANPNGVRIDYLELAGLPAFLVVAYGGYKAGEWVINYTLYMMYSAKLMELNFNLSQSYRNSGLYGTEIKPGVWVDEAYIMMESQRLYPEMWNAVEQYGRKALVAPSSSPGRWIVKP